MRSWHVIDSGTLAPEAIMAKDAALLEELQAKDSPILHLYEWAMPCLTYGYFTKLEQHLHLDVLQHKGLHIARRPTGGGIIFHLTDLAFSLLVPASHSYFSLNTLDSYAVINAHVARVIMQWSKQGIHPTLFTKDVACGKNMCYSFCMAAPTPYDLVVAGKKVGGAAQRRRRQGLLHQATLSLALPSVDLLQAILRDAQDVIPLMQTQSFCLLGPQATPAELQQARIELRQALVGSLINI